MSEEQGDHPVPPVRLDQTAAILANAVVFALAGFVGDDPVRRGAAMMVFLHELTAKVKDRKIIRAVLGALVDEMDNADEAPPRG